MVDSKSREPKSAQMKERLTFGEQLHQDLRIRDYPLPATTIEEEPTQVPEDDVEFHATRLEAPTFELKGPPVDMLVQYTYDMEPPAVTHDK